MSDTRSTFDAWMNAFNAHDEQAIRALTADDCVFEGPGGVHLEGGDAVAGYAMVWLNAFSDAHLSAHQVVVDGDWVAMTGTFKGTHDGTLAAPDGRRPRHGPRPRGPLLAVRPLLRRQVGRGAPLLRPDGRDHAARADAAGGGRDCVACRWAARRRTGQPTVR